MQIRGLHALMNRLRDPAHVAKDGVFSDITRLAEGRFLDELWVTPH